MKSAAEPQRVEPVSVLPAPVVAYVPAQERASTAQQATEAAQDNALAFNDPVPALINATTSPRRSGDKSPAASSEEQEEEQKDGSELLILKVRGKQSAKTQFWGVRSEAIEKSKAMRARLQIAWLRATDKQRWQRFGAGVARKIEPSVRKVQRLSNVVSSAQSFLQLQLRQARPVWERVKGSLLIWMKQPLPLPQRWLGSNILVPREKRGDIASASTVRRTYRRTRQRFQVVTLLTQRQGVNVALLRWLREPFRSSRALPVSRATVSHNRLNSV